MGNNINNAAHIGFGALVTIINLVTIFGNFMLLFIIIRTRQLHTITNVFICSLAVGDMMMGVTVMPFSATTWIANTWIFGERLCQATAFFHSTTSAATVLNLAMVSVDRCFAITRPLRYNLIMTPYSTLGMIAYVWLQSLLFSSMPFFGWGRYHFSESRALCTVDTSSNLSYIITERTLSTLIPAGILTFVFARIIKEAYVRQKRIFVALPVPWPVNAQGQTAPSYKRTTIRAMRTLFVMVSALALLCLPYQVVYMMCVFVPSRVPPSGVSITTVVMLTSSAINPILITILNKKFYEKFRSMMCGKCARMTPVIDVSAVDGSAAAAHHTVHTQSTYMRSEITGSAFGGGSSVATPEVSSVAFEHSDVDQVEDASEQPSGRAEHEGSSPVTDFEIGEHSQLENEEDPPGTRGRESAESSGVVRRERRKKHRTGDRSRAQLASTSQMNRNLLMPPGPVPELTIPAFYLEKQKEEGRPDKS
ncbi:octopamine receptor beta-2R-like [Ptychodera flava]|uniref:octopamine receptor beta-2R-like n=1 Tax=Ptychodera flava TaxID=63121 RepID=UPI00396A861F